MSKLIQTEYENKSEDTKIKITRQSKRRIDRSYIDKMVKKPSDDVNALEALCEY
jgi:DNA-binding protein YbaB